MHRLRLLETLNHARCELDACIDDEAAPMLRRRVNDAERNLALYDANCSGASLEQRRSGQLPDVPEKDLLSAFESTSTASMLIDPRAGLHIIGINKA